MRKRRSKNHTVDFVVEALKMLDQKEIDQVAKAINSRYSEKPVIDIGPKKPAPTPSTKTTSGQPDLTNMLLNMLGNNKLGQLFQSSNLDSGVSLPFLSGPLLSFLPKLFKISSSVFNSQSREEKLINALVPYFSPDLRSQAGNFKIYAKLYEIYRQMKE